MYGSGDIVPPLSTSGLDGGEWPAPCPGRFTPGERGTSTHCIGGLMATEHCGKGKYLLPLPGIEPWSVQPIACHYTNCAIPDPYRTMHFHIPWFDEYIKFLLGGNVFIFHVTTSQAFLHQNSLCICPPPPLNCM
jgi:hypothetical protein